MIHALLPPKLTSLDTVTVQLLDTLTSRKYSSRKNSKNFSRQLTKRKLIA